MNSTTRRAASLRGAVTRRALLVSLLWAGGCAQELTPLDAAPVPDASAAMDAVVLEDARETLDARHLAPDAPAPPRDAPSLPGTSTVLRLDGDGDGVELPRNPEYGLVGTRFTIELWFRPASPDVADISTLYARRAEYGEYALYYSRADDGLLWMLVFVDGASSEAGAVRLASTTRPAAGEWHHAAGVVDGRSIRLYLDGVLEAETTAPADITWRPDDARALLHPEYRTFIGHYRSPADGGARYSSRFSGDVDDVRVSRVARYAGALITPPVVSDADGDTVGLWTFDEPSGTIAEDTSPAGSLDGTIVGGVRIRSGR